MTLQHQPTIWQRVFGMDLRSLAAFRIVAGFLLLIDLWMRWQSLEAMYTDAGLMPLAMWTNFLNEISDRPGALSWSLHAWNGSWQWQAFLFAVAAIASCLLILGYRTRLATIVSWILLVSVQVRNPIILTSGDTLFRVALFWSMFLPLGAVWSLDARRHRPGALDRSGSEYTSPATAGLILLLFSLYFFAGVSKMNGYWFSGNAMEYVSRLDIYSTEIGRRLREFPELMRWITWITLAAEVVLPFFLLVPWRNRLWRVLLMIVFFGLHIGIALTMNIGLFQYVAMAIWLALVPGQVWDVLARRFAVFGRPSVPEPAGAGAVSWPSRAGWAISLFFVIYFLLWNIANISSIPACRYAMPQPLRLVGRYLNLRQEFQMFDVPPLHSPWFVYDAKLADGSHIDIFRDQPVSYERPASVLKVIPRHHWRRWHRNLVRDNLGFEPFRQRTAEYMMEHWNATHGQQEQVVSLTVTAFLDELEPHQDEPGGQLVRVWSQLGQDELNRDLFDDLLRQMKQKGEILP